LRTGIAANVANSVEVETTGAAKEQKLMSKTYAITDLHGRFDLLEMAWRA
jgi:hypothetical protein